MYKKTIFMIVLTLWLVPACLAAGDIPGQVKSQLELKNIPLYPGAVYCTGDNPSVGIRFASEESPEKVREWYMAKFPKWSIRDKFGSWILYDGPPDAGMAKVMSGKQILIKTNELVPSWHSLPASMTTEIMIAFPD